MDAQPCLKCNTLPEDILMLTCNHDLCLKCAAQRLQSGRKSQSPGIVCEFCGKRTELDNETLYELEKVGGVSQKSASTSLKKDYKENVNASYMKKMESTNSMAEVRKSLGGLTGVVNKYTLSSRDQNSHRSRNNTSVSEKTSVGNMLPHTKPHNFCQIHPEEQVLYYCFQCNCQCICPQCVIHGQHNGHQVQTIKKSYPTIKSYLNTHLQNLNRNLDELSTKQSQLTKSIDCATTITQTTKKHIQKGFNVLVDQIRAKEKEILAKCDAVLGVVVEGYKGNREGLQERVKERKEVAGQIAGVMMMREEMAVLNYYAGNSQGLESLGGKINVAEFIINKPREPLLPEHIAKQISELTAQIDSIDIDPSIQLDKISAFSTKVDRQADRSVDRDKIEKFERIQRIERITERPEQQLKPTYQPQGIQRYVNRETSSIGRQLLAVPSRHEL